MDSPAFLKEELRESIEVLENETCDSFLLVPWCLFINDIDAVNVSLTDKFISYIYLIDILAAY